MGYHAGDRWSPQLRFIVVPCRSRLLPVFFSSRILVLWFQRSLDSNGTDCHSLDDLYLSSDLKEPVDQVPHVVISLRFFRILFLLLLLRGLLFYSYMQLLHGVLGLEDSVHPMGCTSLL